MKWHKTSLRVGTLALLVAMLLRFALSGVFGSAWGIFAQPQLAAFLIYSETGRTPAVPTETTIPTTTQPAPTEPVPTEPAPTEPTPITPVIPVNPVKPVFSAEDSQLFSLTYSFKIGTKPNVKKLLTQTLSWDLTGSKPTVLIIHSHATEAYTKTADSQYDNFAAYRTQDENYNMVSIGDELARLLEDQGIKVIHDRTAYDYLDYDNAYTKARKSIQTHLKENPSIKVVLDLHRDSAQNADGSEWATKATVDGKDAAPLMLVVGTNGSGQPHPNWQTNLSIAEKMAVLLEREDPGVCRPIQVRYKHYNQDLCPGSLIVEVGTAGNTHQQAMNTMPALADAIIALAKGS